MLVSQVGEEIVEAVQITPQECALEGVAGQIADKLVSQILERLVEVIQVVLQERIPERIVERIVDVSRLADSGTNRPGREICAVR